MQQEDYLYPLSMQHEEELRQCLIIRKGVENNTDVAVLKDFTVSFWKQSLQPHIRAEEDRLLPGLEKFQFSAHYVHMIRRDHDLMRTLMERIHVDGDEHKVYEVFAGLVEYHIRFEEDVFFPKIGELLTDLQLREIHRSLETVSAVPAFGHYPVRFWD